MSNSTVHLDSCMLFGGRCPAVIGIPRTGGIILTAFVARDRCVCSASIHTFGYAGDPDSVVACAGGAASFQIVLSLGHRRYRNWCSEWC